MKLNYALLFIAFSGTILFSCKKKTATTSDINTVNYDNFLNNYIDSSIKPGDDFFLYAMGTWIKNNPVPPSEKSWGIWSKVNEENFERLKTINENAAANTKSIKGSDEQKLGDFWFTGMDSIAIESDGMKSLKPYFDRINTIKSVQDILSESAYLQSIGVGVLFGNYIYQDEKNSDKMMVHLYQGGIGLPDRDYYFDMDNRTENIRDAYVLHIAKMFSLIGNDVSTSAAYAKTIMKIETDLAKSSRKLEDMRDPYANYTKLDIATLNAKTTSINWSEFLKNTGAINIDTVIVGQPEFFTQLNKSIQTESIENWKIYLQWNLINTFADKLSSSFDSENFNFYGTILNGTPEQRPRWKRVLDEEENAMGFMLGKLYVDQFYSAKTKERYRVITDAVIDTYKERIQQLDWMSDSTKTKALVKLNTVVKKVGFPDKWRDYSSLQIDRSSYISNCISANKYLVAYEISKLYKPVDKTEWDMTPQTWNAYYNPSNNEIVLPAAAFIVPGVPDEYVDDAIAYGYAAGSTIGHEITHGFDDQGRQFDEKGNLVNWWTKSDEINFLNRTNMIVNQFNNYTVLDSIHINGEATQGENIADLGGMLLGLEAFKKTDQYKSGKSIGGFTPTQRYFLGFALSWYGQVRPEALAVRVKTDVHAPNFLRVNGPASNIQEFYDAFNVQLSDKMYVPDSLRVKIW